MATVPGPAGRNPALLSIQDFFDMVYELMTQLYGREWATYRHAFFFEEDAENLPVPLITYRVAQLAPADLGKEQHRKPRPMGAYPATDPRLAQSVYLQHMDYLVHFRLWHREADKLYRMVEQFLDMMTFHLGALKARGVDEVFLTLGEEEPPQHAYHRQGLVNFDLAFAVRLKRVHQITVPTITQAHVPFPKVSPSPSS